MLVKDYKNQIFEMQFGSLLDGKHAGLPTYYCHADIKDICVDGDWIPNPGYDLEKTKNQLIAVIESKILEASIKLDKSVSLGLKTQIDDINIKIRELNKQRDEINAI